MSLAWVERVSDAEPLPRVYRYSVRCDRVREHAIARAAKKAGMSPEAFVQAHFDRILEARGDDDAPVAAEPDLREQAARESGRARRDDSDRAADLGIDVPALRLLRVASHLADETGGFDLDTKLLGDLAGIPSGMVPRAAMRLNQQSFLVRLSLAANGRPGRWRVVRRET